MISKRSVRAREGLPVGARACADVVLRVHVGGRAELARELDHVAAAHLEAATLVQARAEGIYVRDGYRGHAAAIMKDTMEHPPPQPPELGDHNGLAYALFMPARHPECGVVILHGAGSAKESHFDFARGCRADGIAALAFDARGHGQSPGAFGPGAIDDVLEMVALLRGPRGHGGAARVEHGRIPGDPCRGRRSLAERRWWRSARPRRIRCGGCCSSGEPLRFRCDIPATERWLGSLDLYEAAARLGPRTALAAPSRPGRRADPVDGERGGPRIGARAEAPAGAPRWAPPLAAARPGVAGALAPLDARGRRRVLRMILV